MVSDFEELLYIDRNIQKMFLEQLFEVCFNCLNEQAIYYEFDQKLMLCFRCANEKKSKSISFTQFNIDLKRERQNLTTTGIKALHVNGIRKMAEDLQNALDQFIFQTKQLKREVQQQKEGEIIYLLSQAVQAKKLFALAESKQKKVAALNRLYGVRQSIKKAGMAKSQHINRINIQNQQFVQLFQRWRTELKIANQNLQSIARCCHFEMPVGASSSTNKNLQLLKTSSLSQLSLKAWGWDQILVKLRKSQKAYSETKELCLFNQKDSHQLVYPLQARSQITRQRSNQQANCQSGYCLTSEYPHNKVIV